MVSNIAVQTSDLANFSGGYLNNSLRKKFNILKKAILVSSGVGFTCNFFHHSYLWECHINVDCKKMNAV